MHRLRETGEETSAQLEVLERGKKKTEAELKDKEAALKSADQRAEERRNELDNVRKVGTLCLYVYFFPFPYRPLQLMLSMMYR